MTITLSPDIEEAVAEKAREQGTTPEQLALDSLRLAFVPHRLTPDKILELAAEVYAGLSEQDVNDVEQIALDRSNFLGERRPL